jgi:hypothetical protein
MIAELENRIELLEMAKESIENDCQNGLMSPDEYVIKVK